VKALGRTGLVVSSLCCGTGAGSSPRLRDGFADLGQQAEATVVAALQSPINFIDTSNNYGAGESERRIGRALRSMGGLPSEAVLATKVDPLPGSDDFSGARVRASVHESLDRLGVDRLQLVYLHDPERTSFAEATGSGGAVEALVELKAEGVIEHLGVAGGPIDVEVEYVQLGVFEVVITHNRYTLVDQSALPLLDEAQRLGVAVVNAAPYGGGLLSRGPAATDRYRYEPADELTMARVRRMQAACEQAEVPLAAAALQFSLRQPLITSTVVGMTAPDRVAETLALAQWPITEALWRSLDELALEGGAGE